MGVSVVIGNMAGDVMPDQYGIRGERSENTCKEVGPGPLVVEGTDPYSATEPICA